MIQKNNSTLLHCATPGAGVRGYCSRCHEDHSLEAGGAIAWARALMQWLNTNGRIDYLSPTLSYPRYTTENLFDEPRGKMFGVLVGRDKGGKRVLLFAFSGQYNGHWSVPGWAPPLFDETQWWALGSDTEKEIKRLGREMNTLERNSTAYSALKKKRKMMSRELMKDFHSLYSLPNFRGHRSILADHFPNGLGIPSGTGDCCGPKLLNCALQRNIVPLAMAEFYWGKENRANTRKHGQFYSACHEKCAPLLGYMLCGLEEKRRAEGV